MAVSIYTGTPGSGKSYRATSNVHRATKRKINVIANFIIDLPEEQKERFTYIPTEKMSPAEFVKFSRERHEKDKKGRISRESQTIIMIDEASILFNSREFNRKDRQDWIVFFSQHRKLGFDVILITQMDRSIDRQIRGVIEYEWTHRKISNWGAKGLFVRIMKGGRSFVAIQKWYCMKTKDGILSREYFGINKKIASTYDTFSMFSAADEAALEKQTFSEKHKSSFENLKNALQGKREKETEDGETQHEAG